MNFKNLNLFRYTCELDLDLLETCLDGRPFRPVAPSHLDSIGFTKIFGLERRYFSAAGCHLFCLLKEDRIIPAAAVKSALIKQVQSIEFKEKRKVASREKAELKEDIFNSMIPQALTKTAEIWAYIDETTKTIAINSSSAKLAVMVCALLKNVFEKGQLFPLQPALSVTQRLTSWVSDGEAPAPFIIGEKCELVEEEGSIRYKNMSLQDESLRHYLANGMMIRQLSLNIEDRMRFVLSEDFIIKEFAIAESLTDEIVSHSDDPLDFLAAELALTGALVRELVRELLWAMGGELAR